MSNTPAAKTSQPLSRAQCETFARDGYLVVRGLAGPQHTATMRDVALAHLFRQVQPLEYEADVAYPGAPATRDAEGGNTVRRLLQAYERDPAFSDWAQCASLTQIIGQLLNSRDLRLTRCHHNCVMTKHPGFSSATLWHQDLRYWSFTDPDLINAWLALEEETPANGCLQLLPGTHHQHVGAGRLDAAKFLRLDHPDNTALVKTARRAPLQPGDVLFFHAGVFHAAGRNTTNHLKLSTIFTYHRSSNLPLPDSRSARLAPVQIRVPTDIAQ